jgi:tRNA threonylcarbamoyladenosine biosynthesis protein TsaB
MPLLLALESATPEVSVALVRDATLLAERRAPAGTPAAEGLLPELDALLREAGIALEAVEAFAVSIGPGSFTSLRIGIATLKGLAFGSRRPVAPVPTLAAVARSAGPAEGPVVALLDARRGELYAGAWRRGGEEPDPSVPEDVYTPEALLARLPERALLVGEGARVLAEAASAAGLAPHPVAPAPAGVPSAGQVGLLGARLLARGKGIDVADLVPFYGRRAQAEVLRTGLAFEPRSGG